MTKEEFLNQLIQNNELNSFLEYIYIPENEKIKMIFNNIENFEDNNPLFLKLKEELQSLNLKTLNLTKSYIYYFSKIEFVDINSILSFLAKNGIEAIIYCADDFYFYVRSSKKIEIQNDNILFIKEEIS